MATQTEVRPVMILRGKRYIEAPAPETQHPIEGVCHFCALNMMDTCLGAVSGAAEKAFGGDCEQRDVIYVAAPASAQKE